jgi:hypothetical protein
MRHIFLLLKESAANEEKLTHLEHAEDHPINAGVEGYKHAVNTLSAVHKTLTGQSGGAGLMTKYDGSPSIVFGHHPKTGKFFVASKSAFNKDPKINYTDEDIETNHGHAPGLVSKLKTALAHLPKVTPHKGVFQGDVMHTSEDVEEKGGKVHFKPNLIKYSTPSTSTEGKAIKDSKIGVYVHTGYEGNDIESMKANYTPNLSGFANHDSVHLMKYGYNNKNADYNEDAQKQFRRHLEDAADVGKSLKSKDYATIEPHTEHIKTYINKTVRDDSKPSAEGLYDHVKGQHEKGIDKVKTQKAKDQKTQAMNSDLSQIRANHETINNVFALHQHLQKAKDVLVTAMSHQQDFDHHIGDTKTKPEGFVAVVNNRPTKLVDRAEFSKQNFLARQ